MLRLPTSSILLRRAYSFRSPRFNPHKYVETEFEKKWRTMSEQEQNAIEETFQELERGDWRHLTKDQIRNSKTTFWKIVYTIYYGVPDVKDPYEGRKLFVGVLGTMTLAYGIFKLVRSYGEHLIN